MKVKSFYGNSVKDALDKARRELGPDAAIVASRQMRPEEGGGCEIVCGFESGAPSRDPGEVIPKPSSQRSLAPAGEKRKGGGVTRLRKTIQSLMTPRDDGFSSEAVRAQLAAAGFPEDLAADILAGVRQRQRQGISHDEALKDELAARISCAPGLTKRIVAFVGPPGAGKTTSLVKVAVRYGLQARKPMHILSMDSWRIGGADALRTYAAGMGVTFEAVETADGLRKSLEEHTGKGLILIDTPGLGPAEKSAFASVAAVLSGHADAEVHLVLPATFGPAGMTAAAQRFRSFLPTKLLITSTDCVDSCLPAVALALTLERPFSFLGTGQIIPEDMAEATPQRLLGATATGDEKAVTSAA